MVEQFGFQPMLNSDRSLLGNPNLHLVISAGLKDYFRLVMQFK
jgi:hypothetical protein